MLFERFAEILTKELSTDKPLLFVLAGHNGAGKTTYFELRIKDLLGDAAEKHINPDEIERDLRKNQELQFTDEEFSKVAQISADEERGHLLNVLEDFSFETVFSHESKLEFLNLARSKGYFVAIVFVLLSSPERSWERVQLRVSKGGHPVPYEKVLSRHPKVIENQKKAIPIANLLLVVDNSEDLPGEPYKEIELYHNGTAV